MINFSVTRQSFYNLSNPGNSTSARFRQGTRICKMIAKSKCSLNTPTLRPLQLTVRVTSLVVSRKVLVYGWRLGSSCQRLDAILTACATNNRIWYQRISLCFLLSCEIGSVILLSGIFSLEVRGNAFYTVPIRFNQSLSLCEVSISLQLIRHGS